MEATTAHFLPEVQGASLARRFVADRLEMWGLRRLRDDAVLCAAELATNAILHCRSPFTVAVRPIAVGVRIDVQDDRPDRLPIPLPVALDPLASGSTGRGLRLVAALSSRWGYFTTDVAKTVWVELVGDSHPREIPAPVIELAARPSEDPGRPVRLVGLPVMAAIASGIQIDDLVREVQLDPGRIQPGELANFYGLLERSARPRLIGRQTAFDAASEGLEHYSLELAVTAEELRAVSELVTFLEEIAHWSDLDSGKVSADVDAMRAWLPGELAAQFAGRPPSPFPSR